MKLKLYTDGAVSNNGKENSVGGWGFVILDEDENILHQGAEGNAPATNQQMELLAVANGLDIILNKLVIDGMIPSITVYSDSAYFCNCFKQKWYESWRNNGWKNSKKQPVANKEIWKLLIEYYEDLHFAVEKVKGHSGDRWNEYVDRLAVGAKGGYDGKKNIRS